MKKLVSLIILFFITIVFKTYAIEVSTLKAEKKLEFSELFPKNICNKIYDNSFFGKKKQVIGRNYFRTLFKS